MHCALRPRPDFSRLSNLIEFGAHREAQAAAGALRDDLIDIERPRSNHKGVGSKTKPATSWSVAFPFA
jgi:hypothetical protein